MTIEELAFKDRKSLVKLNESDLLDIIEFLQKDRKQWINQFTQTHNESIDIQKENQELKKQLEEKQNPLKGIFAQVNDDTLLRDCGNMNAEINELKNQQKEFMKWLEDNIDKLIEIIIDNRIENNRSHLNYLIYKNNLYTEILQKYKEIIGGKE